MTISDWFLMDFSKVFFQICNCTFTLLWLHVTNEYRKLNTISFTLDHFIIWKLKYSQGSSLSAPTELVSICSLSHLEWELLYMKQLIIDKQKGVQCLTQGHMWADVHTDCMQRSNLRLLHPLDMWISRSFLKRLQNVWHWGKCTLCFFSPKTFSILKG